MGLIIQRRFLLTQGDSDLESKYPADLKWNRWPVWIEMGGRIPPEYACGITSKEKIIEVENNQTAQLGSGGVSRLYCYQSHLFAWTGF